MQKTFVEFGISVLMELLYAIAIYEYFKTFFQSKRGRITYIYVFILSFCVHIIQNNLLIKYDYLRVALSTVAVIMISFFFIGTVGERIVFSILYIALSMLSELLIACAFVTCGVSIAVNGVVGYFLTYLSLFCFALILQYFCQDSVIMYGSWKINLKVMLLTIGSMFIAYRIFYTQYELGIKGFYWRTIISIIILLCINIMMFNIYIKLSENLELERKTSIYEKEFDLLEQYMHEREKLMKDFRVKRYDLKHQMLNLLELLHQKEYGKLELEIERLAELKSLDGLFLVQTDNSFIDTFINNKYAIAHEHGIDFMVNLSVPAQLPFAGEDLCVILGNALDNAIEACIRGNVENPNIKLQMMFDGDNLTIIIENTFDGKLGKAKKGGWTTRKQNAQQHGIGIYSIKNTIKKYNGYYHVDINKFKYCLEIILYRKCE